ncbi:MAG: (d)CMP kinase [Ruminococcaceae bacterium]|nr:(d)CMP kinase [Oscillospiraceae bacterium]
MKNISVAIDGPAGAGKSTISKVVAKTLGLIYVDTGAMYRAVALYAIQNGMDTKNADGALEKSLDKISIDIAYQDGEQHIFLNGEDVSGIIRTPEVSMGASNVATLPCVRLKLVELQREIAKKQSVIMDGRDIGTYVLPSADIKIFLTASVEARAKRRHKELIEKGTSVSYEEVLLDMQKRDLNDSTRAFAPLKQADDAVLIDTTEYDFDASVDKILSHIKENMK